MKNIFSKSHWKISHYAAILFVLFIFAAVNYIGYKKHFRKDYSIDRYLTLSQQTRNLLRNLPGPITITSFMSEEADPLSEMIKETVDNLLKEYQYRSNGKITAQNISPFSNLEKAQEVVQKYKLSSKEDVIIIAYGEQSRVLKISDMASMDASGLIYQEMPKIKAFNAEAQISGAIMSLTQGKKAKVYFTLGHGEPDPTQTDESLSGISVLATRIKNQNCDVEKLDLANEGKIPDDISLLIILGPKFPFTADEMTQLKNYLLHNGRLILLLDPQRKTGLENLLESYGVTFNDDMILRPVVALSASGIAQGISEEAVGSAFADHPAISWIKQMGTHLPLGTTRSIAINEHSDKLSAQNPTEVTSLIQTADKSWGETRYANLDNENANPAFDPKTDHPGPLNLAVAIDSGAVQGGQVNLQGTKIIAVGCANSFLNKQISTLHADFFINAINWMLDRKESLGITPKVPKEFTLTLTPTQRQSMTLFTLVIVPLFGIVMGIWVWFRRRR